MSIVELEDAKVGSNNFNWDDTVSSAPMIKLPLKNLKVRTDSGGKLNLTKFTKVC